MQVRNLERIHSFSAVSVGEASRRTALNRAAASIGNMRRVAELEQNNTQLEQAIYSLVHDLREPLRQIGTQTQFLMRHLNSAMDRESATRFESVMAGVELMESMIDATLNLGERTHESALVMAVDTRAVMNSVLQNFPVGETSAIVRVGYMPPVAANREHVWHIFQNLVGNAIKYRSERPLELGVEATREKNVWVFAVRDNGMGIEHDDYDRIFEMFRRGRNNTAREGNGLGLATCKSIVERYNGRIWVKSVPGEGSTFFFTLPVVSAGSVGKKAAERERVARSSAAPGRHCNERRQ
jgi:light-regulated signal transduction histidine kinase (bacteriophytochrome)